MKKLIFLIILIISFPIYVKATSGAIKVDSIKKCPDGILYGYHGEKGKKGLHWHQVEPKDKGYYPKNNKEYFEDPCPEVKEHYMASLNDNNNIVDNQEIKEETKEVDSILEQKKENEQGLEEQLSNLELKEVPIIDNTIKKITIDDQEIEISNEMNYQTTKKHVDINIELNDKNSILEYENRDLEIGNNLILITLTDLNGNVNSYKLNINKEKATGKAYLKKFIIDEKEIQFIDYKGTYEKLKGENKFDYKYELSDENATLLIYINDIKSHKLESIKKGDIIKLVVIDIDDNEIIYEITIEEAPLSISILVYVLTIFTISIIVGIIILIIKKVKK